MNKDRLLSCLLVVIIILLLILRPGGNSSKEDAELSIIQPELTNQAPKVLGGKRSFGPKSNVYSKPPVVIGSYNEDGTANVMSASWYGIVNSKPLKVSVSLRPATHSYHNLVRDGVYTVNIPNESLASFVAFVGHHSGRDMDKFEQTGFTPVKAEYVNAPYVDEFPVVLECNVTESHDLGSHRMFIAEVIDTKVNENILNEHGQVDVNLFKQLFVGAGGYIGSGSVIGQGKELRKKYETGLFEEAQ